MTVKNFKVCRSFFATSSKLVKYNIETPYPHFAFRTLAILDKNRKWQRPTNKNKKRATQPLQKKKGRKNIRVQPTRTYAYLSQQRM